MVLVDKGWPDKPGGMHIININKGNSHVLDKYIWIAKYFNKVVTDDNACYPIPPMGGKKFRVTYKDLEITSNLVMHYL